MNKRIVITSILILLIVALFFKRVLHLSLPRENVGTARTPTMTTHPSVVPTVTTSPEQDQKAINDELNQLDKDMQKVNKDTINQDSQPY